MENLGLSHIHPQQDRHRRLLAAWGNLNAKTHTVVPVKEEATVPPTPIHQANITFADPVVDDVVAHIHAPKHEDKLNEAFEKHHNAAH